MSINIKRVRGIRHFNRAAARVAICLVIVICSSIIQPSIVRAQNQQTIYSDIFDEVKEYLDAKQIQLKSTAFVSYDSNGSPYPSNVYTYDYFMTVLETMSVSGVGGGGNEMRFYLGFDESTSSGKGILYGLINIAAFLAQAMMVSIKYDVCDEFHMDDYIGCE